MKRTASDSRLGTWLTIAPCGFMAHKTENFYTILSNTIIESIIIQPKIKNYKFLKMKLNFIFCVLAVPTLSLIVTGTLGCGNRFRLRTFRGRTIAIPLDPECAVGPASDLGRIRNPYQPKMGPEIRRWRQNWSRWMAFTDRRYTSHWKIKNSTSETKKNSKTF